MDHSDMKRAGQGMLLQGQAKIVQTKDLSGNKNGFLMELQKEKDLTTAYLTVCEPNCFKGYHLHKVREANYVVIKGEVDVIVWEQSYSGGIEKTTYTLGQGDKINIPTMMPTGIHNKSSEEVWIISFPSPAYDPKLTDEQVDYTEDECLDGKFLGLNK